MPLSKKSVRVPVGRAGSVADLVAQAAGERVVLTKWGRPVAVLDDADRHAELAAEVAELRRVVTDRYLDVAAARSAATASPEGLDAACAKLGIDPSAVRAAAEQ